MRSIVEPFLTNTVKQAICQVQIYFIWVYIRQNVLTGGRKPVGFARTRRNELFGAKQENVIFWRYNVNAYRNRLRSEHHPSGFMLAKSLAGDSEIELLFETGGNRL